MSDYLDFCEGNVNKNRTDTNEQQGKSEGSDGHSEAFTRKATTGDDELSLDSSGSKAEKPERTNVRL